ncbi:MAG: tRNA-(ms[2]io[6]A)-hydroxylase [Pseudomonadales bacterium]|nr:tRNA-(ms[2]io[6]A)-hydroxylase [Pseudomonadales bacterium]
MTALLGDDYVLRATSPDDWLKAVTADFPAFLQDHAANERKASAMAMSLVAHYPDRAVLVEAMIDLALEELNHFRQVVRLMIPRDIPLAADEKDPYVNGIIRRIRKGPDLYFLDRLLTAAVIEARGAERFRLVGEAMSEPDLAVFYQTLARSEANHHQLFIRLALTYYDEPVVASRLSEWLDIEAEVMHGLEIRARLH